MKLLTNLLMKVFKPIFWPILKLTYLRFAVAKTVNVTKTTKTLVNGVFIFGYCCPSWYLLWISAPDSLTFHVRAVLNCLPRVCNALFIEEEVKRFNTRAIIFWQAIRSGMIGVSPPNWLVTIFTIADALRWCGRNMWANHLLHRPLVLLRQIIDFFDLLY